eukprot:TRINITY_DN48881_c0_g1_i1.p1 TRINITY_DN48881_c0_g1~~TRINITY_DN48881_c0_g1_i1.p1  ORF type:complete len:395 (-),score=71.74 TRINITY_DN48881_c0_g1_i1:84-1214(-)
MAPKGAGKKIAVEGLPPGWEAIEKMYLTGKHAGSTYMRFQTMDGRHRNVLSLKAALKADAEERGLDPEETIREYERHKEEQKQRLEAEKEAQGKIKGEKKDEAIRLFRETYGKLDGATVCKLPGWRGESKVLERCGQVSARYFDPDGRMFCLINEVEAFLGMKIQNGGEIPDIDKARNSLEYDETGKLINTARTEGLVAEISKPEIQVKSRKRRRIAVFQEEDYNENGRFTLMRASEANEDLRKSANTIRTELEKRGFAKADDLIAVCIGAEPADGLLTALGGVYYRRPDEFAERPYYQKVLLAQGEHEEQAIACRGVFIYWSTQRLCWKIGTLDDSRAGYAFCAEDLAEPVGFSQPWRVLQADGQSMRTDSAAAS